MNLLLIVHVDKDSAHLLMVVLFPAPCQVQMLHLQKSENLVARSKLLVMRVLIKNLVS